MWLKAVQSLSKTWEWYTLFQQLGWLWLWLRITFIQWKKPDKHLDGDKAQVKKLWQGLIAFIIMKPSYLFNIQLCEPQYSTVVQCHPDWLKCYIKKPHIQITHVAFILNFLCFDISSIWIKIVSFKHCGSHFLELQFHWTMNYGSYIKRYCFLLLCLLIIITLCWIFTDLSLLFIITNNSYFYSEKRADSYFKCLKGNSHYLSEFTTT